MLKPKQLRQLIACGNDQLESISSFVVHFAHFTFHRYLCNLLFSLSFLFFTRRLFASFKTQVLMFRKIIFMNV